MKDLNQYTKSSVLLTALILSGCLGTTEVTSTKGPDSDPSGNDALTDKDGVNLDLNKQGPSFSVELYRIDAQGASQLQYREVPLYGSFEMEAGRNYKLLVRSNQSGVRVQLKLGSKSLAEISPNEEVLIARPNPSNEVLTIEASKEDASIQPTIKNYNVAVMCTEAIGSSLAVNGNAIVVQPSGEDNHYNFSAPAAVSGGSGDYQCAWDFNGDGIRDEAFHRCTETVTQYSNHVDTRRVGLFVYDLKCNRTAQASADRVLASLSHAELLSMENTVFLTGTVRHSAAASDPRLNLRHVSINTNLETKADCIYNRSTGTFSISGVHSYNERYSKVHGIKLSFSGMSHTLDIPNLTGSVNTSSARISSVGFDTDTAPDSQAQLRFLGDSSKCTGSIEMEPVEISGVPCTTDGNHVTGAFVFRARGNFSCQGLPTADATQKTIDIEDGAFYCEYRQADSCIGGGGGGGGGVVDIEL